MSKKPEAIKISSDSFLLQIKSITMFGDYYRVIMGTKELTTTESLKRPKYTKDTVLFTEERFAGEAEGRYTLNEISVSPILAEPDPLDPNGNSNGLNKLPKDDFNFKEIGNYQMRGLIFNYQVVPTLNKGPKVIKSFIVPNHIFSIKGYLGDHIKTKQLPPPPPKKSDPDGADIGKNPLPEPKNPPTDDGIPKDLKDNFISNASNLRKVITQGMEYHISI